MDVSYLLDSLNDKQREAVAASRTNMLVLAGAGSGKTRVLVHRIAWLQSVENCSPYSIMAVTFTNKAAAEMLPDEECIFPPPVLRKDIMKLQLFIEKISLRILSYIVV